MKIIDLSLQGLKLIRLNVFHDDRGYFKESYRKSRYIDGGVDCEFVQDNLSYSKKNVVRGMHFDLSQAKLVSVLQGKIFDVAVDIRPASPSFGKWEGVYLEEGRHEQLYIPPGFAHGFCVVSDGGAYVHYKVSSPYNPATEQSFRFDDPNINIQWPIQNPIISLRDQQAPLLCEVS
ncbi:MAG TPA: dTDP-4-dehydrorhamnose 3,5-epimerase [Rhabdochlamydiaceae bacterium]|nr:dTDP-4-dehydrorhamnose 3,5-epimerase [Rhabdochlamydiaceae bacterium]